MDVVTTSLLPSFGLGCALAESLVAVMVSWLVYGGDILSGRNLVPKGI